jgi:hypothetical protein
MVVVRFPVMAGQEEESKEKELAVFPNRSRKH